ncbi:homeobox protein NANOG [Cololabis saira]|uniref:homeobox protein NANOG n=1 Tax=Cololabis saira TaxID=129043 RepID=UPI002AD4EC18|nr:homeobox protein NANOG [Cololabis saira]
MADWKTQVSYNYNSAYHAYAYGLVYQPGAEQPHHTHHTHHTHHNLADWGDAGAQDLSSYDGGAAQGCYSATAGPRAQPSAPVSGACYPAPGLGHVGGPQGGNAARRAGSDSASDSEAHTSPDSWSSVSSRESSLPQADPVTWAEKDESEDVVGRSPDTNNDVSSSLMEEPQTFDIMGNKATENQASLNGAPATPKKPCTTPGNTPKGKARAAFSECQMNALVQRFSVQRYLTPGEMKNLAELTGLTYKQVKTWFQNRRMKLRRHQKDTSWVSERYAVKKDNSVRGPIFSNGTSHITPYQGDARPQFREHYAQHMEAAFKSAPQNLAFYLAAMGGAPRPAGYHPWSSGSSQGAVANRPHVSGWPMPLDGSRYDYNPNAFNAPGAVNNFEHSASFETKDGESGGTHASLNAAMPHNAGQ